jgi:hypothetical protein
MTVRSHFEIQGLKLLLLHQPSAAMEMVRQDAARGSTGRFACGGMGSQPRADRSL